MSQPPVARAEIITSRTQVGLAVGVPLAGDASAVGSAACDIEQAGGVSG